MLLLHPFQLLLTSPKGCRMQLEEAAFAAGVTVSQEAAPPAASRAEASSLEKDTGNFGEDMEAHGSFKGL